MIMLQTSELLDLQLDIVLVLLIQLMLYISSFYES